MNQEVFELVMELDVTDIEIQFAMQCAPVIMGLKISNLLIVPNKSIDKVWTILEGSKLSSQVLLRKEEKIVILVYRMDSLREYLSQAEIKKLLWRLGYRKVEWEELLPVFIGRYQRYCRYGGDFPHEMGILLGYPVEDVIGFIENNGKNFLYLGYWKVYKDKKEKIRLFQKFELAKKALIQLTATGISMAEVVKRGDEVFPTIYTQNKRKKRYKNEYCNYWWT